jgi:hypothetical protein
MNDALKATCDMGAAGATGRGVVSRPTAGLGFRPSMVTQTASEYGMFHAHFARLSEALAATLFYLGTNRDPPTFEKLISKEFGRNITALERQAKSSDGADNFRRVGSVCVKMRDLAKWRNERIHARVKFDQDRSSFALYSWRTRQLLPMTPQEIRQKSVQTSGLVSELSLILRHVGHVRDVQARLERAFKKAGTPSCAQ